MPSTPENGNTIKELQIRGVTAQIEARIGQLFLQKFNDLIHGFVGTNAPYMVQVTRLENELGEHSQGITATEREIPAASITESRLVDPDGTVRQVIDKVLYLEGGLATLITTTQEGTEIKNVETAQLPSSRLRPNVTLDEAVRRDGVTAIRRQVEGHE